LFDLNRNFVDEKSIDDVNKMCTSLICHNWRRNELRFLLSFGRFYEKHRMKIKPRGVSICLDMIGLELSQHVLDQDKNRDLSLNLSLDS
jgi:hypothetical protein